MNLFETCLKFHKKNITCPIINILFVLVIRDIILY